MTEAQRALLPDPTANLNWSKFRGAIHDIFAENAEKHPDRPCVVETKPDSFPHREFTYRQINEASNILAHHLVQSGIQRGEVVMAYAYRGVDLMVAVMGILKAGATFFAIDPAYPPERQNIYLDVARPGHSLLLRRLPGTLVSYRRRFAHSSAKTWNFGRKCLHCLSAMMARSWEVQ